MRILFVDANVCHINPTASLLHILFRDCFPDTVYFGPGFSPREEISRGLRRYVDAAGPFDVLVLGSNVPIMSLDSTGAIAAAADYQQRFTFHRFSRAELVGFLQDIQQAVGSLEIPVKLVSALNFDYYAATQRQIDGLLEQGLGILGPNEQFVARLADLPDFARGEKHYIKKADRLSDAWHDFLRNNPDKVVTAVHFVAQQEFCFEPLDSRPYDVAVPGVEYLLRREAKRRIAHSHFRIAPKHYFHLYRWANRLGLPVYSNFVLLRLYNLLFQRTLADTRCTYTARGGFGIPIRKFFEIPAAGTLLLCSPCNGFQDLGFEPGRHYLAVEPESLVDALTEWLAKPRAQEIARAGQKLILDLHSLSARGKQIERCLHAMIGGRFREARWDAGKYVVSETPQ